MTSRPPVRGPRPCCRRKFPVSGGRERPPVRRRRSGGVSAPQGQPNSDCSARTVPRVRRSRRILAPGFGHPQRADSHAPSLCAALSIRRFRARPFADGWSKHPRPGPARWSDSRRPALRAAAAWGELADDKLAWNLLAGSSRRSRRPLAVVSACLLPSVVAQAHPKRGLRQTRPPLRTGQTRRSARNRCATRAAKSAAALARPLVGNCSVTTTV